MSGRDERTAQLEAEIEQLHQQLFRLGRLAEMGKLVAVVAHELSQPLLGIKAFAQILQRRCKDDSDLAPKIDIILQQARVMEGIVDGLREFTRPAESAERSVDLAEVVSTAVELFAEKARKAKVLLKPEVAADLPQARGKRGHLQQVVVNLVSNAIDALGGVGGGEVRIQLAARPDGLLLRVADTGPGVPDEIRAKLFEPFFTTKDAGKGTGLGLSICRDILAVHGGSIELLDRPAVEASLGPGFGAVFEVRLAPAADGSVGDATDAG